MNLNLFLSAVHISFVKLSVLSETFTFRSGHDFSWICTRLLDRFMHGVMHMSETLILASGSVIRATLLAQAEVCLLYTSDAADE